MYEAHLNTKRVNCSLLPIADGLTFSAPIPACLILGANAYDDSQLQSNQLLGTIPSTIGSLVNLQYLYEEHLSEMASSSIAHSIYLIRTV